jgi:competence protein ComEC
MSSTMRTVGLVPGLAIIAGAACGPALGSLAGLLVWLLPILVVASIITWRLRITCHTTMALALGFWTCSVVLAAHATDQALHPSFRSVLDREVGGFDIEGLGPEHDHDPILTRAVLTEDASPREGYVSLRAQVTAVSLRGVWQSVDGGVTLSVSGAASLDRRLEWRAQRVVELPATFRRASRFLNDGVPDFERALALDGTTLLGTVKSGLLVERIARGGPVAERAADVRAHVRRALERWVAPHDAVSAAIAAAVLIGDRTGLPDETREALQAAGTYHVIAISGGNIAIVAAASCGVLALVGIRGRLAAALTIVVLLAFATVVTAGPSVWRATLMAIAYFAARALDHRTPVWQAAAIAAGGILIIRPLDVSDPGFVLTFGATTALVEGARRGAALLPRARALSWVVATCLGSAAVEAALVPVSAFAFSRVTSAGLLLNLLAVPAMAVVQIAATIVTVADSLTWLPYCAGWATHIAASALVSSAHLVTEAPWLAARVPPPGVALMVVYYAALIAAITTRGWLRAAGVIVAVAALTVIVTGTELARIGGRDRSVHPLTLTVFDVGQGESLLLETGARKMLVDTGGAPFGGGLDIGRRVLGPALWARGIRSLDAMLVTHSDPDHLGGAIAAANDFRPRQIWEGIRVPRHGPTRDLLIDAARLRIPVMPLRAGQSVHADGFQIRVLHPPEPNWERRRVRNDDSVVLEIVHGDVALLLTGDISAEIERSIIPLLTPAKTRILKVAHHGSRTSSSVEFLEAWRPQIAIISCGRGNRFGHPAPEVLRRLEAIGATVFRTDRDGQITIQTDGSLITSRTFALTNSANRPATSSGRGLSIRTATVPDSSARRRARLRSYR